MLDFLHVEYSTDEVLDRLKDDVTTFKRPKPARDFDPYTLQQKQEIYSVLGRFLVWLKAKDEETMFQTIRYYLLQH